jgi:tetratricopeptide (TPR) repeat protein
MRNSLSILTGCLLFLFTGYHAVAQAPPKPRDTTIQGPQTFAMVMGISKYKYVKPLDYADKDAEMFRDYLKSPAGGRLPDDNIYCLLNEQAISTTFWSKGFKWLEAKKLRKGDRLFIYLAGHGDAIDEDQFFYIAYDCNPAGDKNNYLAGGVIQLYNLKLKIQRETGKGVEVFFIMDACRSNELPGGKEGQNFLNTAISEKRTGEIMMLATAAGQESLEDVSIGNGHGLFTYYLVDGLTGMADEMTEADNKITLSEIKKYVDKNVPSIAQQQFKRKQDPFFCCTENSEITVSIVDTAYLRKWLQTKKQQSGGGASFNGLAGRRGFNFNAADTQLAETYNLFNKAVKESRLTGKESADYYYGLLEKKFPGNSYTVDAQSTLAVEFINFAQAKINLYLDCKDPATIQKIRAQIDEDENTDEIITSLDRMEKVARQEFYEVGNMLEKAIGFIMQDDPDFARTLLGRMYFFKARGYFNKSRKLVDINNAFQYAWSAYASDNKAAYILNTLSSLHLDNNRIDSAIIYAKRAIITAPKWRYPYVTLAFCYKTLNRPDSAIRYYRKSIETDPGNADAYVDLGHYYYSLSRPDSAISNYQKALQIEPGNVYASNNLGWLNHDRKNYDQAIIYFKQSITADPKFLNAYNGISKTFFATKQFDSARVYFSRAFINYQDKSIVNVYIGNFYKDLKEYDSAKVYYRLAAAFDPNYEDAFNDLGRVCFELKQFDSANFYYRKALEVNPFAAYSLINIGLVFKELKQNDSTYFYFQRAIQVEPRNAGILNNVGVIYGQDKIYDSARKYFRRALDVKPDYKPASKNLLKIFKEMNLADSISNILRNSFIQDPASVSFSNDMGMAFLDMKRYDSARAYFKKGLLMEPRNAQLMNKMGLALQGLKLYDSAKVYMQWSIRIDPENPLFWGNIAGVFKQMKQADSAALYYQKQLQRRTDLSENPVLLHTAGSFFSDLKMYDSAIVYYRWALTLDNNYLPALNNAGIAHMELQQYDSAFSYFRRAVNIDPTYQNASLNLGLLYHTLEQYDSAIVYIQNAIKLDPTKSKNYFSLACSYALNKKPEQAITYLRQAYERGYKNTEALTTDPDLSGLKIYKEFQALLEKYVPGWKDKQ